MVMSQISQLGVCAEELAVAATTIAAFCKHHGNSGLAGDQIPPDAPLKVQLAKRSLIANTHKIEALLGDPTVFIQRLAREVRSHVRLASLLPILMLLLPDPIACMRTVARRVSSACLRACCGLRAL